MTLKGCLIFYRDFVFCYFLDDYLCHYEGTTAIIHNNQCVIPYSQVITYFLDLWEYLGIRNFAKADRKKVSNDLPFLLGYGCAEPPSEPGLTCNVSFSCYNAHFCKKPRKIFFFIIIGY